MKVCKYWPQTINMNRLFIHLLPRVRGFTQLICFMKTSKWEKLSFTKLLLAPTVRSSVSGLWIATYLRRSSYRSLGPLWPFQGPHGDMWKTTMFVCKTDKKTGVFWGKFLGTYNYTLDDFYDSINNLHKPTSYVFAKRCYIYIYLSIYSCL